jgi:glutaredoxin
MSTDTRPGDETLSPPAPDDKVVLFMRKGCHVCARVKGFLEENEVPYTLREVDEEPLTPKELWTLFTKKASRLRVPFTVLNDGEDVVLGYDPLRLEGVLLRGDRGGWQVSTPVTDERVYDDFTGTSVDEARWIVEGDRSSVTTGGGRLTIDGPATLHTVERFKTMPGTTVSVRVGLSAEPDTDAFLAMTDPTSGLALGFDVGAGTVAAVHERRLLPGVTLPEEAFRHVVATPADAATTHAYEVRYEQDTNRVEWCVDGAVVYWATTPRPLEGCSLELGLTGTGRAEWTPPTLHA